MHPIRGDPSRLNQPIAIELDHARDTVPVKNQKMFRNVASIEIGELKDALAYAEKLLAQNMEEREDLLKRDAEHQFEMKRADERLGAANKARQNAEAEVTELNQKFKQMENNQEKVSQSHAVFNRFFVPISIDARLSSDKAGCPSNRDRCAH